MTNPTSNFGWQMPTSTDLVTDLPADFEVFGQAVDTSLADLKGGTTGQVLSKTTNTNMDFTWVTPQVGDITSVTAGTGLSGGGTTGDVTLSINTAITADLTTAQTLTNKTLTSPVLTTPTISTINAKGDLLAGTADNTIAALTVGANNTILTADSSTATGLKWAAPAGGGKVLQVVAASYSTQTSSSSSTFADTGLTVNITPSSATSKVLVLVTQNGVRKQTNDTAVGIKLFKDATEIAVLATDAGDTSSTARNEVGTVGISLLHEPATTSTITYKTQFRSVSNNASAIVQLGGAVSSIVLLEIGA